LKVGLFFRRLHRWVLSCGWENLHADFAEIPRGVGFESRVIISADYTDV